MVWGGEVQVRGSLGTSLRGERCWVNYAAIRNYEQVQRCIRRSPDQPQNETQRRVACSSLAPRTLTHTKHPTCVLFRQHSPRKVRLAAARQPFRLNRLMTAVSFDKNTPSADSQGRPPGGVRVCVLAPDTQHAPSGAEACPPTSTIPPRPPCHKMTRAGRLHTLRLIARITAGGRWGGGAAWQRGLSWLPVPLFQVGSAIRQSAGSKE